MHCALQVAVQQQLTSRLSHVTSGCGVTEYTKDMAVSQSALLVPGRNAKAGAGVLAAAPVAAVGASLKCVAENLGPHGDDVRMARNSLATKDELHITAKG